MPTYRNDTENRITHCDKTYIAWQPGEVKSLPYFVPYKVMGLTLVDEQPYVRKDTSVHDYQEFELTPGDAPIIYDIPYRETFELSLSVLTGTVKMYIGDSEVPTVLDIWHDHVSTYAWDQTGWLKFEVLGNEVAQWIVKVEAKTWKDARKKGGY